MNSVPNALICDSSSAVKAAISVRRVSGGGGGCGSARLPASVRRGSRRRVKRMSYPRGTATTSRSCTGTNGRSIGLVVTGKVPNRIPRRAVPRPSCSARPGALHEVAASPSLARKGSPGVGGADQVRTSNSESPAPSRGAGRLSHSGTVAVGSPVLRGRGRRGSEPCPLSDELRPARSPVRAGPKGECPVPAAYRPTRNPSSAPNARPMQNSDTASRIAACDTRPLNEAWS